MCEESYPRCVTGLEKTTSDVCRTAVRSPSCCSRRIQAPSQTSLSCSRVHTEFSTLIFCSLCDFYIIVLVVNDISNTLYNRTGSVCDRLKNVDFKSSMILTVLNQLMRVTVMQSCWQITNKWCCWRFWWRGCSTSETQVKKVDLRQRLSSSSQ